MSTQATYDKFTGSAAEMYERHFVPVIPAPLAADLLALTPPEPGHRVLDVACGTGIVARLAAELVGPSGEVTGVDLAPDMLAMAQSLSGAAGVPIAWREANAEALPFDDDTFDVGYSQLGLMFVPDKAAAVGEMRRVVRAGGRVAIAVAGRIQPINEIMDEAIATHINPDLAGFVSGVFSMHDPAILDGLLNGAGFEDVDAREVVKTIHLPAPADFLWQYVNATPMGGFVAQAPEEARAALEREIVERWQPLVDGDGMTYDQPIVFATARA